MLYLAEVQKKSGMIRSGKAELRLLACQRSENSWSAVPGEELIPAPDDAAYNAGALVMVELSGNRQVQRHSEAGRQLISILQNFSRLQEKFKTQEEEIEQWKESLIFQSQELNSRQAEMDAREEQLRQMEEDFAQLENQKQEIDTNRDELSRLKEEFERKSQELEGAWAHLRGEMNRFEEQKGELQQAAYLDDAKASQMQELLNRLSGAIAPTESVREHLNLSFEILDQQQGALDQHWQALEEQRNTANQMQEGVDQQTQANQDSWRGWRHTQNELEQAKTTLAAQQQALEVKQGYVQSLTSQLRQQEEVYQQISQLSTGAVVKIDTSALEQMPLEDLQKTVQDLEKDLEKVSRFVQGQEEELSLQQEANNELRQRMENASDYERLQLETELADEQDRYRMLNETLVGQRRNLQERQAVLKRHQVVLANRQGLSTPDEQEPVVNVEPVLAQLDTLRQELSEVLQRTQAEIQELQGSLEQARADVEWRNNELDARWNELQQQTQELQAQKTQVGEMWGKVNTAQETLQLAQNSASGLKDKLQAIAELMAQFQEASDYQLQAIAEMRQSILSLVQTPELAAS